MRKTYGLLAAAFMGSALAAPAFAQDAVPAEAPAEAAAEAPAFTGDASTVLARVGDTEITLGQAIVYRTQLPPQLQQIPAPAIYPALVQQLIEQELLAQSLPDDLTAAEQARLNVAVRAIHAELALMRVLDDVVTDESIQTAYDAFSAEFAATEAVEHNAAHILVNDPEVLAQVLAALEEGREFADVAGEFSIDGSARQGGELGWFGAGAMIPEFEEAVVALEVGEVSEPVESRFGTHIIKLLDRRDAVVPPLEDLREELANQIRGEAVSELMEGLRAGATVEDLSAEVDPEALMRLDLVNE